MLASWEVQRGYTPLLSAWELAREVLRIIMQKIEVFLLDMREAERLIRDHLFINHEVVPAEELSNGSYFMCNATGPHNDIPEYERKEIDKLRNGDWIPYRTKMLFNHMVRLGCIEKGRYLIDCSW